MPIAEGQDETPRASFHDNDIHHPEADTRVTGEATPDVSVHYGDEMLTIQAAARLAGVSRASVLSWIRNGFIAAQTSPQGWMVRAGDIELARNGAEEARRGVAGDEQLPNDSHALMSDARNMTEQSRSLVARPSDSGYATDSHSDAFLAPLAEFVRDQTDIVQEQAETIGWLQSELRRAKQQLEELEARNSGQPAHEVVEQTEAPEKATDRLQSERVAAFHTDPVPAFDIDGSADPVAELRAASYDIIAEDPFSEEAARARMMIEETERKITDLWEEQQQKQARHSRERYHSSPPDDSWLRRIVHSWKKQESR